MAASAEKLIIFDTTLRDGEQSPGASMTKDEKIMFGERDVTENVEIELMQNPRIQKERELYIRADKDARYGVVARVVAAARRAGVEGLNLLVQPELEDDPAAAKTTPPAATATSKKK